MNSKTKRILSGAGAIVVALALALGGTYAYTLFEHKSNPFRNDPNYQGRLVEDYEEKEWEKDVKIKKEISVKNMGGTEQFPGRNWGDIFVRVKLKEHMDITPIDYIYYPGAGADKYIRFMVDKDGNFVRFPATGANTTLTATQLDTIRASAAWSNVIADSARRAAFTSALTEANFIRLRGYYDTQDYWYVVTKEGDPNGQYGAFVVMEKTADPAGRIYITPSVRATGMDYGTGLVAPTPSDHENEECLYPVHYWDQYEPQTCDLDTHKYVEWELGKTAGGGDTWIMADAWDGQPVKKWILDPVSGWATWSDALTPGEQTDLLLQSVTPIRTPDGQLLYVIHADMQCTDLFEMLKDDFWFDENGDPDEWFIRDTFDPSGKTTGVSGVSILGGDKTMVEGDEIQLEARVRPNNATNKGVKWRSSDTSVATVDDDGNVVAVGEGEATITVTTDDGDFEDEITITVVLGTIPATDVNITTTGPITIEVGQTKTIEYAVVPSDSTDAASLRSGSVSTVSIVSNTQIKGEAVGTTTVYVEAGGISKPITVNVVAATVPATDINITTGSPMTIEVGQTLPVNYTVVPAGSTDAASLRSGNASIVSVVSATQIKGEAVGTATVYVEAGSVSKPITVNVVAATPGTLTIDVGAAGITIEVGEEKDIPHTIAPPNTSYAPQWTTAAGTGSVTIVNQNGRIRGATVGAATVTLTVGSKSATVNVTVIPAADPSLPLIGGGAYNMKGSEIDAENYSLVYDIDAENFAVPFEMSQDGTIKLSDILEPSFTNYSSLSVTSSDPAVASKVSIGTDKDGDDAIVVKYYGTQAQWEAARSTPSRLAQVQITLVLSAPGYQDATITINMAFQGSMYG